jgi:dTDP-4-dehydrorhamnose reductase
VEKVLIAGIETVIGGNLAVCLSDLQPVVGVSLSAAVSFSGCELETRPALTEEAVHHLVDRVRPRRLIFCGRGARSGWESSNPPCEADALQARWWAHAARQMGAQLTLISSDAIFTGPWMFHAENSQSFCASPAAQCLRSIEANIAEACPDSLIVRTHAFGWQPGGNGWIEALLARLEQGQESGVDCARHASPILASDLVDIISRSWAAGLSGIYHIAGAERVNPVQFVKRLAHQFRLAIPIALARQSLIDCPTGFGCGETSLQTRKIRRALGIALPMLDEGLQRLFQQVASSHRSRVGGPSMITPSRVA